MTQHVILLKDPGNRDYESELSKFSVSYVPILSTYHVNTNELEGIVKESPRGLYSGVIATSARSIQNFEKDWLDQWSSTPFYVVGRATEQKLKETFAGCLDSVVVGTGTGENLARSIVQNHRDPKGLPLLYLTGDKNRDTVASILTEARLPFTPLQVYGTTFRTAAVEEYGSVVQSIPEGSTLWVAFFSPSGVDIYMEHLASAMQDPKREVHYAAIGSTTENHMREKHGITPHVVAREPTAKHLAEALDSYTKRPKTTQ